MNNNVNFDTSNKPFSEIIGNGKKYFVPKYQRDYAWEEEQWEELWQDILAIHQQKPEAREEHYMGYLVLQKEAINTFKIIDGQQRITTLSLLVLATLQILQKSNCEDDNKRIALIKSSYISTTNSATLEESHKLELNRNNDAYYRNDLANLTENPRKRNIKATEHKMRKAKEFYQKQIERLNFSGEQLGGFIENIISNYLLFTVITVGNDVNAYKVFETLNARGVQLSTPDLVKNHLFSIIDLKFDNVNVIERQEEKWAITLDNLGREDFTKFLRCFWNSRNPIASKTNLFKKIKIKYSQYQNAIQLLDDLKGASTIYAALQNHNDELWVSMSNQANQTKIQHCLLALKIFNMVQPYPVLLSAKLFYSDIDFARICQWIHTFCIRYQVICSLPAYEVERFYNQLAVAIYKQNSIETIKQTIIAKLPNDANFKKHFAIKTLPTQQSSKQAYYFLASIENYLSPNNPFALQGQYSIEHILPRNATTDDGYWQQQFGDQLEQYIDRLGNLTLLTDADNKKADKLPFPEKKHIYQNRSLQLVKKLSQYQVWNPDNINNFQNDIAKIAVQVWSIT